MAGYGTSIEAPSRVDELVRALLRAAKRRACRLELSMTYERRAVDEHTSRWTVNVDGNGMRIAAWAQQLERDLPVVAEGAAAMSSISTNDATVIAESLVSRWIVLIAPDDWPERDLRVSIRTTVRDENRIAWPVIWFPEDVLSYRDQLHDEAVARWIVGDLPTEVVVEDIHTLVERALRVATGSGRNARFPALLSRARGKGEFTRLLDDDDIAVLRRVNDERTRLKHEGKALSAVQRTTLDAEIWRTIVVLDTLLRAGTDEPEAPGTT